MRANFIDGTSDVQIQISPENETECVALRLFIQYNELDEDSNIFICTDIEDKK